MFSPHRIVFWLSVALQGVNALNAAAPSEMVYIYNAYKMEFLTFIAGLEKNSSRMHSCTLYREPRSTSGYHKHQPRCECDSGRGSGNLHFQRIYEACPNLWVGESNA